LKTRLKVLVTARLSDYKLRTKLIGLLENRRIGTVLLVRRFPLPFYHPKLTNIAPRGVFAADIVLYELWRLWTLWRLTAHGIDLLVGIQLSLHGLQVALIGRLRGIPSVLGVVGSDVHIHLRSRCKRPLFAWALRGAAVVTVMGTASRRRISKTGVDPATILEIQNFHDPERFQPHNRSPRYDFIYVGSLIALKCVDTLLGALAKLETTGAGARTAILGDGPDRRRLEALAQELGLGARIDFLGWQRSVEDYLNVSRVLVLASRSEAMPAVAIEAMYCGIPSVLTAVGDIPAWFEHEKNALLVPPGNPEALADALCRVLSEPALYESLRKGALAARERHMKKWGIAGQVQRWDDILRAAGLFRPPSFSAE
jgi:glycosyltransferase involved in cell wall biosynthesis